MDQTLTTLRKPPRQEVGRSAPGLQTSAHTSPRARQLSSLEASANSSTQARQLQALRSSLNSRPISPPVQRLRLGANGDLDTQNVDQIDQVVAELLSLDYDSLLFIRGLLDPMDDADYIKLINYELGKADTLRAVSQASYDYGGIFTSASVFLDGQLLGTTEPISHPDSSTQYYQKVLDSQQATELELAEEHNSRNDSEVSTLEEAYNLLYAQRQYLTQSSVVRILVAGTSGPCDGCKKRLEQLRTDALALLPPGAFLSVESSYLNSTQVKDRNEVQTRYGFQNQTTEFSARGDRYYNFRYPLARQTAPTTQLATLQPSLASRAASPATDAGIVQRTVAEDLAAMGLRQQAGAPEDRHLRDRGAAHGGDPWDIP